MSKKLLDRIVIRANGELKQTVRRLGELHGTDNDSATIRRLIRIAAKKLPKITEVKS